MLAKGEVCFPGSIHVQAHGLSNSLGKLLGVHFLLMTMERVVKVWEKKWLALAELQHWLFLLLCTSVSGRAFSRAANICDIHQDITASQT